MEAPAADNTAAHIASETTAAAGNVTTQCVDIIILEEAAALHVNMQRMNLSDGMAATVGYRQGVSPPVGGDRG